MAAEQAKQGIDFEKTEDAIQKKQQQRLELARGRPQQPASEASLEYAAIARTGVQVLPKPETYDDKLIHSYVERGYEPEVMITSAIPFVMDRDLDWLIADSQAAERELAEFEKTKPTEEEGSEEEAVERDNQELMDKWKAYNFGKAVIESRILTDDDILAWKVMTPFCESLPEKLLEAWMAGKETGSRAATGERNIGSVVTGQKSLNETSEVGRGIRKRISEWVKGK